MREGSFHARRRFRIEAEPATGALLAVTGIAVVKPTRGVGRSISCTLSADAVVSVAIVCPTGRVLRRVAQERTANMGRNHVA